MENEEKNKIREPYPPEETPNPPQIIDPNVRNERNEPGEPARDEKKPESKGEKKDDKQKETGRRLGDPIEINDETTI